MGWLNPNSTTDNSTSLVSQGRAQNQSIIGQDMNLFVYDAFEYDDSNTTDSPVLSMKEGWTFDVGEITTDQITNFTEEVEEASDTSDIYIKLDAISKDIEILYEDSEWNSSQITVGQGEIDLRVTSGEETSAKFAQAFITLGVDIDGGASISIGASNVVTSTDENLEEATSRYNNALIELNADDDGSSISLSADKITLDGDLTLDDTLYVSDGEVYINGRLAVGTATDNDKFVVNSDGSVTCTDLTATSGTFNGNLVAQSSDALKKTVVTDGGVYCYYRTSSANSWSLAGSMIPQSASTSAALGKINFSTDIYVNSLRIGSGLNGDGQSVGIGYDSLKASTTGYANTSVGRDSCKALTTGHANTVLGAYAGASLTSGKGNVEIGYGTGGVTTGDYNVQIGYSADASSNATYSIVIGYGAYAYDYGSVIIGKGAGSTLTPGRNNIILGADANPSAAYVNNECTLGGSSITNLRCNDTSISSLSDARDKTDIKDSPFGLDYLMSLRPVDFLWASREGNIKDGTREVGFLAQELLESEELFDAADLKTVHTNNPDRYEADYGKLLVVAVKAIQELKEELDSLKEKI